MKAILSFLFLALFINDICGQQQDSSVYTREYYIQKSKDNKTAGNIFLFGGLGLSLVGILSSGGGSSDGIKTDYTGPALFLAGLAGALISIPCYISSRQNLLKALKLSAGTVRVSGVPQCGIRTGIVQPALVLRLNIR